jgi:lambda family phage portal protein
MSEAPPPTFLDRLVSFVSPEAGFRRGMAREAIRLFGYDGASPGRLRGFSGGIGKNAASESWRAQRDRVNIMWDARDMERNFAFVGGVLDRTAQYVCNKVVYQARTGDQEVDRKYEEYFREWAARADITGRHNLRELVELGFKSMLRDGDHGFVLRNHGAEVRLQSIESDRIGSPLEGLQNENYINGISINELGQPTSYRVFRRTRTAQYVEPVEVPPSLFIHLFRPLRSDQYRGVSWLATALPHARDLYELMGFEKQAAKFASAHAGFIKPKDPNARGAMSWDTVDDHGVASVSAQAGKILKLSGAEDIVFPPGTQRPSGAFMSLVDAIIREMALGLNLPYGFCYNLAAFGGVTARIETMQAQRVFQRFQVLLRDRMLDRTKDQVIARGIIQNRIPAHPRWRAGAWQFGAHITGDVGNQTQADLALVSAGIKTRSHLCQEYLGEDFEEVTTQLAREVRITQDEGSRQKVPVEMINGTMQGGTGMLAAINTPPSPPAPPPPGLIGQMGDKAAGQILETLKAVSEGRLDPRSAFQTLTTVFGIDPATAQKLIPGVPVDAGSLP